MTTTFGSSVSTGGAWPSSRLNTSRIPSRTCVMTCFGVMPPSASAPRLSTMKACCASNSSHQGIRRTCEYSMGGFFAGTSLTMRRMRLAVRSFRCRS